MLVDIGFAFVYALLIQYIKLGFGKRVINFIFVIISLVAIIAYFISGFNFIGTMDFAAWIFFCILFYNISELVLSKCRKEKTYVEDNMVRR